MFIFILKFNDNLLLSEIIVRIKMSLCNFENSNIKFTILECENKKLNKDDCCVEIIINRNFLNEVLINYAINYYYGLDNDFSLTKREQEVLKYISDGLNNTQIAKKLNVSIHTTKVHIHNIFNKLSVQCRTEAVTKGLKYHLIRL